MSEQVRSADDELCTVCHEWEPTDQDDFRLTRHEIDVLTRAERQLSGGSDARPSSDDRLRPLPMALHPDADLPARAQLVEHAVSAGHPLCPVPKPTHSDPDAVCGRSLSSTDPTHACEGCLTQVRADLAVIRDLYAELPAHLRTVPGSALGGARGGDGRPLPGGVVLALLGPGNMGGAARRLTAQMPAHLRTEVDVMRDAEGREHRVDNRPEDTASVEFSLCSWTLDWKEMRGDVA